MKLIKILLILSIVVILNISTIASAEGAPTTYTTYVDIGMGFYKVRDLTTPSHKFDYENRALNISQGDTMIWKNDAEKTTFTLVSEQGLWDKNVGYLRIGDKINYKFDKPGTYNFYIQENVVAKQTIVVNGGIATITATPKINPISNTPIRTVIATDIKKPSGIGINNNISSYSPFKNNATAPLEILGKIPIKVTNVFILGIGVAISCIIVMFLAWKNKI